MGTKNDPGNFDCYENAEPDEPMFILLARDSDAAYTVRGWARRRRDVDGDTPKVREAFDCADEMDAWRQANRP